VDSRHSSELLAATLLLLAALGQGCSTVRPQDKELLADPAMNYGAGGEAALQEEHVLSNREGAAGAGRSSGGGCGCN
jgi:Domain of unknown function (DUF4266)